MVDWFGFKRRAALREIRVTGKEVQKFWGQPREHGTPYDAAEIRHNTAYENAGRMRGGRGWHRRVERAWEESNTRPQSKR